MLAVVPLALCAWLSSTLATASPVLKRPGDADLTVQSSNDGFLKRPALTATRLANDAPPHAPLIKINKAVLSQAPQKAASKPDERPSSPLSLDHMWNQAGGHDELDKILDSFRQDSPNAQTPHSTTPSQHQVGIGHWVPERRKKVAQSPLSGFRPPWSAAQLQLEKKKAAALKRLAKDPEGTDLLSQVQRARYTNRIEELPPPSKKPRWKEAQESLRTKSGHSILKNKWMVPTRGNHWSLKVSSDKAVQAKKQLKHYTNSEAEIEAYLQRLTTDEITVMAEKKPGSSEVEEIFKRFPPPTTWSNVIHHRISERFKFKFPHPADEVAKQW